MFRKEIAPLLRQRHLWLYLLLALLVGSLPIIENWAYLKYYFGGSIFDHIPLDSDSLVYWTELNAMKHVGLGSGYFGYEQLHAKYLGFDYHGFWYPAIIYVLSLFQKWQYHSILLVQLAFLSLSVFCYMILVRTTVSRTVGVALFLLTFYPIIWSTTMSVQDCLHFSFAIVLAALYNNYLASFGTQSRAFRYKLILLLFLTIITLSRVSWLIAIIPLLLLDTFTAHKALMRMTVAACYLIFMSVLYYLSMKLFNAPYPYTDVESIGAFVKCLSGTCTPLLGMVVENIKYLTAPPQASDSFSSFAFRYTVLTTVFFTLFLSIMNRTKFNGSFYFWTHMLVLVVVSLGSLAMLILVHDTFPVTFFRHISPAVIFVFLLTAPHVPVKQITVILVVCFLMLPFQMSMFNSFTHVIMDPHGYKRRLAAEDRSEMQKLMTHTASTKDRWCNTVLSVSYDPAISFPPGVSIKVTRDFSAVQEIKSRYVVLPSGQFTEDVTRLQLTLLGKTKSLDIYENKSLTCAP